MHSRKQQYFICNLSGILILLLTQTALSQTNFNNNEVLKARIVQTDHVRLFQYEQGSERPCFCLTFNIVDKNGIPIEMVFKNKIERFSTFNLNEEMKKKLKIFDNDIPINTYYIHIENTDISQVLNNRRYTILLIDHSGSMRRKVDAHHTKFEIAKESCLKFAENFVDNIDYVAAIPFSSNQVNEKINSEKFMSSKEYLIKQINTIKPPIFGANTGLFSAIYAALERLNRIRKELKTKENLLAQFLLVVMTDGKNDVGHDGDDMNLIDDWNIVKKFSDQVGIQIITIGFGKKEDIDEEILKQLAWPTTDVYQKAHQRTELIRAFETARKFQINRIQITFFPHETIRKQLVNRKQFIIQLNSDNSNSPVHQTFSWLPGKLMAGSDTPFEGTITQNVREHLQSVQKYSRFHFCFQYMSILLFFSILFYILWFKLPKYIWSEEYDVQIYFERLITNKKEY